MTITLELPQSVEHIIQENAIERGLALGDYVTNIILEEARRNQQARNRRLIELLDNWDDATPEEIAEQKRSWTILRAGLQENHDGYRTLFPEGCGL